ncbi:MAG: hypothetical protein GPJ51_02465 [Candidatus Heimdallarchaeota archaeon]|nr:hypothetical protein [Candidatus Heimdallarchaeota archaeon]
MIRLSEKQMNILKHSIRGSAVLFFWIITLYILDYAIIGNVLIHVEIGDTFIVVVNSHVAFFLVNISIQIVSILFAVLWFIYLLNYIGRIKRLSVEHPILSYNNVTIISSILLILIGLAIVGWDIYHIVDILT